MTGIYRLLDSPANIYSVEGRRKINSSSRFAGNWNKSEQIVFEHIYHRKSNYHPQGLLYDGWFNCDYSDHIVYCDSFNIDWQLLIAG